MIDNPATEATYQGLTHRCMNPHCHVPAFIASLHEADEPTPVYDATIADQPHGGRLLTLVPQPEDQ